VAVDVGVKQQFQQRVAEEGRRVVADGLQPENQFFGDVLDEVFGAAVVGLLEDGPPQLVCFPLFDVCHQGGVVFFVELSL
jgi:hypothetical protein